jgi:hypothetical protein
MRSLRKVGHGTISGMKVWLAIRDVYEDRHVAGVFSSLEAAQRKFADIGPFVQERNVNGPVDYWSNDRDWEDAMYIAPSDVED